MLEGRLHRVVLLFVMIPVFAIGAFSLRPSPEARTVALAPDAFDSQAAMADLKSLRAIPDRSPGSIGDDKAAQFVAMRFRAAGLKVTVQRSQTSTIAGDRSTTTVRAVRTGFSQAKVVIAADRATPGSGETPLTGTATLLELARAIGGRTVMHTVEFVSTGSGPGGALAEFSTPAESTIAAVVLGETSGAVLHRPFVVPWAEARSVAAPLALERTAAAALANETGLNPGAPTSSSRLARLALPLTTGDQGQLLASGVPAVSVSSAGENALDGSATAGGQMDAFGRSLLRLAGVLDGGSLKWPGPPSAAIPIRDRELPPWVLGLLSGSLLAVGLVVGVDGLARARRRRIPVLASIRWFASAWPVFCLPWMWLLLAGATGVIPGVPASLPTAGLVPVAWAAVIGVPVVGVLGWLFIRPALRGGKTDDGRTDAGLVPGEAAPAALMLIGVAGGAAIWLVNPVSALLVVAFVHIAPWLVDPKRTTRRRSGLLLLTITVLPILWAMLSLMSSFGAGPLQFAWLVMLQFSGGAVGLLGGLMATLFAGLLSGVAVVLFRADQDTDFDFVTRGPLTYAGPGSLGGTESLLKRR
ncbi:MAG: hypothetical protein WCI34_03940 [Actinomycetes bacterium]